MKNRRKITRHFTKLRAEGSVLIEDGRNTRFSAASVITGVPSWQQGRVKALGDREYGLLPRATGTRTDREAAAEGKPDQPGPDSGDSASDRSPQPPRAPAVIDHQGAWQHDQDRLRCAAG